MNGKVQVGGLAAAVAVTGVTGKTSFSLFPCSLSRSVVQGPVHPVHPNHLEGFKNVSSQAPLVLSADLSS